MMANTIANAPPHQRPRYAPHQSKARKSALSPDDRPLGLLNIVGNCVCTPFQLGDYRVEKPRNSLVQVVELHTIRFIGLGALIDELTPRQRVYDTLEQLTARTDRLISVGYLQTPGAGTNGVGSLRKVTETVPLDAWDQNFPQDSAMSREAKRTIDGIRNRDFENLGKELQRKLDYQLKNLQKADNKYLAGITSHNLGVARVLVGREKEAEKLFRQAISLKEAAFGLHQPHEIALSWCELGIQRFAQSDFEGALSAFGRAHELELCSGLVCAPEVAMTLNNIACCKFQMGNRQEALETLMEARKLQQPHDAGVMESTMIQADLDLLHVATVISNCGYLKLTLKQYDEARPLFESALLIQQSVLDDSHRAIQDTRSNIEFSSVFHSLD